MKNLIKISLNKMDILKAVSKFKVKDIEPKIYYIELKYKGFIHRELLCQYTFEMAYAKVVDNFFSYLKEKTLDKSPNYGDIRIEKYLISTFSNILEGFIDNNINVGKREDKNVIIGKIIKGDYDLYKKYRKKLTKNEKKFIEETIRTDRI